MSKRRSSDGPMLPVEEDELPFKLKYRPKKDLLANKQVSASPDISDDAAADIELGVVDSNKPSVKDTNSVDPEYPGQAGEDPDTPRAVPKSQQTPKEAGGGDNSGGKHESRNSIFGKFPKPTSSGEPSHNIPRRICEPTNDCLMRIAYRSIIPLIFIVSLFIVNPLQNEIRRFIDWLEYTDDTIGVIAYIFAVFDSSVLTFTVMDIILALGSGYIYGTWFGMVYCWVGVSLGSTFAFWIGRLLYRDFWFTFFSRFETYRLIDHCIKDFSFFLIVFCRLSPYLPYGVVSYLMALTDIPTHIFLLGHLAMLPVILIMSHTGNDISDIRSLTSGALYQNDLSRIVVIVLLIVSSLGIIGTAAFIYFQFIKVMRGSLSNEMTASLEGGGADTDESTSSDDSDGSQSVELALADDAENGNDAGAANSGDGATSPQSEKPKKRKKRKKKKGKKKKKKGGNNGGMFEFNFKWWNKNDSKKDSQHQETELLETQMSVNDHPMVDV